jgi:2-polyprenyl-6-methoxyphenol hydroxylase-like FAD-dependent oxidoreductase
MLFGIWVMSGQGTGLTVEDAILVVTLLLGVMLLLIAPDAIEEYRHRRKPPREDD